MTLRCAECGCEFHSWEEIYSWEYDGVPDFVCEDCFDALLSELTRAEKARRMGLDVRDAGELAGR